MIYCLICKSKPIHSRGMCGTCYNREWRKENFVHIYASLDKCIIDKCENDAIGLHMCRKHYMQAYRALLKEEQEWD